MSDTYNGYTNWETYVVMVYYDEDLYDVAKAFHNARMTFDEFKNHVEKIIYEDYEDCEDDYNLSSEFIWHCLGKVNFKEIAELVWKEE